MVTGLEWNVRISGVRNPDVVAKMTAVFDSYWASGDFVAFDHDQFRERTAVTEPEHALLLSPIEIVLMPFQERLLEQVELARTLGRHRNLLVAATGTGKTVMAAVDYARLRERLPRDRLLFVAHREEILDQSRATFAHALRDASFGEYLGRRKATCSLRARLRVDPEPQPIGSRIGGPVALRRRHRRRVPSRGGTVVPDASGAHARRESCSG